MSGLSNRSFSGEEANVTRVAPLGAVVAVGPPLDPGSPPPPPEPEVNAISATAATATAMTAIWLFFMSAPGAVVGGDAGARRMRASSNHRARGERERDGHRPPARGGVSGRGAGAGRAT